MTAQRRQQAESISRAAAGTPAPQRDEFLKDTCGTDNDLRAEVERLLSIDAREMGPSSRLSAGDHLGPYEIAGLLGAGGMGEVYQARDPRLNRAVAIKVLPRRFSVDADRGKRLVREARAASALNHPNIVIIHDVLSESGQDSIVMELIAGRTLSTAIGRKGLPVREALNYATQIAAALAAAHAAGIVHRDLKPQNVMVTDSGLIKVLDFGLATSETPTGPDDETATMTTPGVVAGTFLYMSPEQAEGKKVDARSDIFAFGSLLFEMLTGRPAFSGDFRMAILTAVLHRDPPPLCSLRENIPVELERIVQLCLRKDPTRRMQSMQDVRILLDEVADSPPVPLAAKARSRAWRRPLLFSAPAFAAAVLLTLLWRPASGPDLSSYRLTPFATEAGEENWPAWSPDGRTLAYAFEVNGVRQIYTRGLEASSGTRLTNCSTDCLLPFWAPDGSRIYYGSQRNLYSVGAAGGVPQTIVSDVISAAISPDGKTMAMTRGTVGDYHLLTASPVGAEPRLYRSAPFSGKLALIAVPQFAPDGRSIAVSISRQAATSEPEIWIIPFPSGAPRRVPVRLPGPQGAFQRPGWMPDSRHLILNADQHLYRLDTRNGDIQRITATTIGEYQPAVSPDGHRIAFAAGTNDSDIYRITTDGVSSQPLLATSRRESDPTWSPVSSSYAYVTTANGLAEIWLRSADGDRAAPLVRQDPALPWYDLEKLRFSPDGQHIAYDLYGAHHVVAISAIAGGRPVIPDQQSPDQHGASWSPDGNWIAYRRLNGAKWELVKRPLGGGEPVWLDDAAEGGAATDWSASGEWICHPFAQTLRLVSADGSRHVVIQTPGMASFGFSRDSRTVYAVRRNPSRKWELASFEIPSGREIKVAPLNLPASAGISGFSPSPDSGKSFIIGVSVARFDIWLLEGFEASTHWYSR